MSERNEHLLSALLDLHSLRHRLHRSPSDSHRLPTPVPTPTPENYGLYTDDDLQIYADSIDLKIQEALKTNNASQAQELGRKRQELIAEFDRRHLKRHSVPERCAILTTLTPRPVNRPVNPPVNRPGNGLPGE